MTIAELQAELQAVEAAACDTFCSGCRAQIWSAELLTSDDLSECCEEPVINKEAMLWLLKCAISNAETPLRPGRV